MTAEAESDVAKPAQEGISGEFAIGGILDGFGEGFCAVDANWRIIGGNRTMERHVGVRLCDVIGRNFWDIAPAPLGSAIAEALKHVARQRVPMELEAMSDLHPGQVMALRVFPLGEGIAVAFRDVTEQHRLREREREQTTRLELALAAAGMGDWSWDAATRRTRMSPRAAEIFGRPGKLEAGWEFLRRNTHPDDLPALHAAGVKAAEGKETYEVTFRVYAPDGAERWLLVRGMPRHGPDGAFLGVLGVVGDVTEARRREARLRESEARFRSMADSAPAPVWVTSAEGSIVFVNDAYARFSGLAKAALLGDAWIGLMHPEDVPDAAAKRAAARSMDPPQPYWFEGRFRHASGEWRWMRATSQPRFDASGAFEGYVGLAIDMTEVRAAETRQQLLINELNHRVKNTLATVQSLAMQTARLSGTKADFTTKFMGRLMALSAAHNRLTQANWGWTDLRVIVEDQITLHGGAGNGMSAEGPNVSIPPSAALSISMAFHELSTNALKYGALSTPQGRVRIAWALEVAANGAETLRIQWSEHGGPPVQPPIEGGFGSRLLRVVGRDLGGEVAYDFLPEGVRWRMSFVLP